MARIYVIEDDEAVRGELATLLRRAGHEPLCAERFDRLAADVEDAAPDVVLLDLGLPGTDGLYVCRELRQTSNVPIIVVTSRTTDLDELMSMSLGADDFIAKPYNGQVLLAHIDAVLRRAQGAQEQGRVVEYRIVSREDIMVELWNSDTFIDDNTLTVNMNRLRKTLASIGVTDYLTTHRGQGYSA